MSEQWMQQGEGDARIFFAFHVHPRKDEARSVAESRLVCVDTDYIKIQTPGDKTNVIDRPLTDEDKQRFGRAYAAWKEGRSEEGLTGTPLKEWPPISASQVEELAYLNIRTVEQLSAVTDGNIRNATGLIALRQKAKDWLEAAKAKAPLSKIRAENETLRNQVEAQARLLDELKAEVRALKKEK